MKIQTSKFARTLIVRDTKRNKMLSYRRETALQGALYFFAKGRRLELGDNILQTL